MDGRAASMLISALLEKAYDLGQTKGQNAFHCLEVLEGMGISR